MAEQPVPASLTPESNSTRQIGQVENLGAPIRLTNVPDLIGFAAEKGRPNCQVKICSTLAVSSEHPVFQVIADELVKAIDGMLFQNGKTANLKTFVVLLLMIKPDQTADLWLDTAAVARRYVVKREIRAAAPVFESDIADITSMFFPAIDIGPKDRVACIFREGWRFGMAFDFNPEGDLDLGNFEASLGTLTRELRYRHVYDAMGDEEHYARLRSFGWFPFVEIITSEVKDLLQHGHSAADMKLLEAEILKNFNEQRMQGILRRWSCKPHFYSRMQLLDAAILAFNRGEPIAVIKILLTEIEGVLADAYQVANDGQNAKLPKLLSFATDSAKIKTEGRNTLLFPSAFAIYLAEHTFKDFDKSKRDGTASSRHAVGHGAAPADSYTMTRALQTILTLDQLAFYT